MRRLKVLPVVLCLAMALSACGANKSGSSDAAANLQASQTFLAENAKKPGIQTTASGLQYEVMKTAEGVAPKATDWVTVNYRGTLPSGQVFDAGEGIAFPLNGVIAGWTEGLQLMKLGSQYRFFIPPDLAYGETGAGRAIGPNMALVFEVELVKVGR